MDLNKLWEAEKILSENQLKISDNISKEFENRKEELKGRVCKEIASLYNTSLPRYFWQERFQRKDNSYRPKDGWMIGSDIPLHDLLSFGYIGSQ